MPPEATKPDETAAAGDGDEQSTSAGDDVRQKLAEGQEEDTTGTGAEAGAETAAEGGDGADGAAGADGDDDGKGAMADADADKDASKGLTAEQLQALADNPQVREAVLGQADTQQTLDGLVREALNQAEVTKETERVQTERADNVREALKKGADDGDYSDLGRLAAESLEQAQQQQAILPRVQAEVYKQYDLAITEAFGEEIEKLSEEDRKALNRSNFDSDGAFLSGVLTKLKATSAELVRASAGVEVKAAEEAGKNAATSANARRDGAAMLGGGSAEEGGNAGDDIGGLMREAMKDALDYEE